MCARKYGKLAHSVRAHKAITGLSNLICLFLQEEHIAHEHSIPHCVTSQVGQGFFPLTFVPYVQLHARVFAYYTFL